MKKSCSRSAATGEVYAGVGYTQIRHEARALTRATATDHLLDDLVQYGALGLVEARARYDPSRGVPFQRFAKHRVRGAMVDGLRENLPLTRRAYLGTRGDERHWPTPHDVHAVLQELCAQLTADAAKDPEDELMSALQIAELRLAFAQLAEEEQSVIVAVYDMGNDGDSGSALAERRGVSRSTVSKEHRRILRRLKTTMEAAHG